MGPRDDVLARLAVLGDQVALSDLLALVRAQALRHAWTRLHDWDEAEDVAQEVLVRVLNSIHTFRFESSFSGWVYRIIENQIKSYFRSRASAELAERKASLLESRPPAIPLPEIRIDVERLWATVRSLLADLPELQERTFKLVVLQDLNPCEVALALGKSQTNVRASLSRARLKIRKRLSRRAPALVEDLGCSKPYRAA